MLAFELQEMLAHNRELISDTWYYFLTVHLAIFGIVHVANRRVSAFERLTLLFAYVGFLYVNYRSQTDNYSLHKSITDELHKLDGIGEYRPLSYLLPRENSFWLATPENLTALYIGVAALAAIIIFSTSWRRDMD